MKMAIGFMYYLGCICCTWFGVLIKVFFLVAENLPDPGKAQDFVKKFNQVLGDDEKLRAQLEQLISPTCSCKQAEVCVVSGPSDWPRLSAYAHSLFCPTPLSGLPASNIWSARPHCPICLHPLTGLPVPNVLSGCFLWLVCPPRVLCPHPLAYLPAPVMLSDNPHCPFCSLSLDCLSF